MNLLHIWGNVSPLSTFCDNDLVADTPPQAGATSLLCPSYPHRTNPMRMCYPEASIHGDMFMNYMDYTDDACMNMFSRGQVTRMRDIFTIPDNLGGRRGILASSTIACVPGFMPLQVFLNADPDELTSGASTLVRASSRGSNPATSFVWEIRELSTTRQWSQWLPLNQGTQTTRTVSMPGGAVSLQIRVTVTNTNGERATFAIIIRNISTGIPRTARMQEPTQTLDLILSAAPNPASDNTTISYQLFIEGTVTIEVINSLQQRIALLVSNARTQVGTQSVNFNVRDLPNGIYIVCATVVDIKTNKVEQKTLQINVLK